MIGLLLAPLVDRLSRRRLLIAPISRASRSSPRCLSPPSPAAIVALAGVVGIATGFFRPAVYAGMPNLVYDARLPDANSLFQAVENLTWMVGPVIGGILIAAQGPDLAYWLNAATFVFSAVLLARIPAMRLQAGKAESRGHWRDIGDGIQFVLRSRALLTVLVVWNVVMLGAAAINVAEVVLAKVSLDSGNIGFGVLVAAGGLGLSLGSFASGTVARPLRPGAGLRARDLADGGRLRGRGRRADDLGSPCSRSFWPRFGNGVGRRLQLPPRPAGRARRASGPGIHGDHVLELRGPRTRHGRGGRAHQRLRRALGVGWRGGCLPVVAASPRAVGARSERGGRARRSMPRRATRQAWPRGLELEQLAAGVRSGDRRALARAISLVENGDPLSYELVRELYPETGSAYVVGVTGPPGVGKSSLISSLVRHVREADRTVGVLSVDPSSPFTQGALLGDRIRLSDHFLDPGVFIRSMGTRGHLGGLAEATLQAALLLDAAGKELVLPRDRRRRPERGRGDRDRRHGPARPDARLG